MTLIGKTDVANFGPCQVRRLQTVNIAQLILTVVSFRLRFRDELQGCTQVCVDKSIETGLHTQSHEPDTDADGRSGSPRGRRS